LRHPYFIYLAPRLTSGPNIQSLTCRITFVRIASVQLLFSLQHYAGDDKIKMFIYDLISPAVDGREKDCKNHTGLSAPVPRGRKGKKGGANKKVESLPPLKKSSFVGDMTKLNINPEVILSDSGYRKHLRRHSNKLVVL